MAQATQANYGLHSHDAHANLPLTQVGSGGQQMLPRLTRCHQEEMGDGEVGKIEVGSGGCGER